MSLDEFQALFDNGSFHRLLFWQPSITEGLSQYQESEFSLQCLAYWEKLFRTINLCANMALLPGAPDIPRVLRSERQLWSSPQPLDASIREDRRLQRSVSPPSFRPFFFEVLLTSALGQALGQSLQM